MASELSKFIEDELRKQGIQDDEEQRLLSNLRIAPLSVQSPGAGAPASGSRGWTTGRKVVLVLTLALLFGGLVALVINYRGHPITTGGWRGAVVDPEAGVDPLPIKPKEQPVAAGTQQAQPGPEEGRGAKNATQPAESPPAGEGQKKAGGEGGRRLMARLPPF